MNISKIDLNLLVYLDVLLREKNVTRAANQLNITQPAMSNGLKRLREAVLKYQDDLADAVSQDFGHRSKDETKLAELLTSLEAIKYASKNLTNWMKPQKRHSGLLATPAKARDAAATADLRQVLSQRATMR